MIVRTSKSVLFFIPWGSRWIVGTTDTDWSGDRAEPTATAEDVDYILGEANRVLATPLTRGDVLAVYAGLRPLVAEPDKPANDKAGNGEKPTTKLSREHVVDSPLPGLTSIAGGKFTTYRLMARDVVDAAVEGLPGHVSPSVTEQLPLLGADGLPAVLAVRTPARGGLRGASCLHRAPDRAVRVRGERRSSTRSAPTAASGGRWSTGIPTCAPR